MKKNILPGTDETFSDISLDLILQSTNIGLWDWHLPSGKVIYSKQWEKIAGYEEGELPQAVTSWEQAVLPADLLIAENAINNYLEGRSKSYEAEFRLVRKDGRIIWAQDKGTITEWDENGKPVRLVGVLQDIDRIKRAEEALAVKQEQLDFVTHLTNLGMWEWDLVSETISYNEEYLHMLGYSQDESTGTLDEWKSLNHPEDLPRIEKALDDYLSGRAESYCEEIRMKHKDGHYIWTLDMGKIFVRDEAGVPLKVLGGHINIDQLKRVQHELKDALYENEEFSKNLQNEVKRGIEDLRIMEQNAKAMFDANPHASVIFDENFRIVDSNPAALDFFGYKDKALFLEEIDTILAKSFQTVNPDGTPAISIRERLIYTFEHGFCQFDTAIVLNGTYYPLDMIFKRINYNNSYAVTAYQLDMTAFKKIMDELEKQDKLLNAVNQVASLLISELDEDFDKLLWRSLDILGKTVDVDRVYIWKNHMENDELHCSQIYEWSLGAEAQQGGDIVANISYRESIPSWEYTLKYDKCINSIVKDMLPEEREKLDPQGILSILIVPIFMQNTFWGFIGFDDCHEQRQFKENDERILRSSGLLFASAVLRHEMTKSLIAAREAALSSARSKSVFLANMSHEIRTPMNAIIGMATIAKNSDPNAKVRDCINKIESACIHLLGIINDILDMSKIEADKFTLSYDTVSSAEFIENIRNLNSNRAIEKDQTLTFNISPSVPLFFIGDELRLSQIMTNIISNAVKFTPAGGTIIFDMYSIKDEQQSMLCFRISDTGIGIEKFKIPLLFQAFEQLDRGVSKKYGGTGLGLAITKRIIDVMGGTINIESEVGKGSVFTVTVPIQECSSNQTASNASEELEDYSFIGKKLLLVEDIEINREIIISLLEDTGILIESAENGQAALDMIVSNPGKYDVILMDIQMPVMDGLMATQKIRALDDSYAKTVPIIAMTANAFNEDIDNCIAAGMNAHIAKPISINEVLIKLKNYLYK